MKTLSGCLLPGLPVMGGEGTGNTMPVWLDMKKLQFMAARRLHRGSYMAVFLPFVSIFHFPVNKNRIEPLFYSHP
jgi:hypothetical protein